MNMRKLTEKSVLALQTAQTTAKEYGNAEIAGVHLLYAILIKKQNHLPRHTFQKKRIN